MGPDPHSLRNVPRGSLSGHNRTKATNDFIDAKREADGLKRDKSDAETKVGRAEAAVAALKQDFGALELRCGEAELERDTAKDATAHGTCLWIAYARVPSTETQVSRG